MSMPAFLAYAALSVAATLVSAALAPAPPTIGKLENLNIPRAELGASIPVVYGTNRVLGNVHYSTVMNQKFKDGSGGFLGIGKAPKMLKYNWADFSVLFCEGVVGLDDLFANGKKLIANFDPNINANPSGSKFSAFQFRRGTSNEVDIVIAFDERTEEFSDQQTTLPGFGTVNFGSTFPIAAMSINAVKYNNIAKAAFHKFRISDYGNSIPAIEAIVTNEGSNLLSDIVADVLDQSTLSSSDYDLTELSTTTVEGAIWERDGSPPSDFLQELSYVYNFNLYRDEQNIIRAKFNDVDTTEHIRIIQEAELNTREYGSQQEKGITRETTNFNELPSAIKLTFRNKDKDYEIGSVKVDRDDVEHENTVTVETNVALSDSDAATIAERLLTDYYIQRHTFKNINLPESFRDVQVMDLIQFTFRGEIVKARVSRKEYGSNGMISLEAVSLYEDVYHPTRTLSSQSRYFTQLANANELGIFSAVPLDLPWLFESAGITNNITQLTVQSSPDQSGSNIPLKEAGVFLQTPTDSNFVEYATLDTSGTELELVTNTGTTTHFTRQESFISVNPISSELTVNQINALDTKFLVIGEEVISFTGVTSISATEWQFSGIERGILGTNTKIIDHSVSSPAFLVTEDTTAIIAESLTRIGQSIDYQVREDDLDEEDLPTTSTATHTGISNRVFTVTQVEGIKQTNGDLIITWQPRARYNNHGFQPSFEYTESFTAYDFTVGGITTTETTNQKTITFAELSGLGITNADPVTVTIVHQGKINSDPITLTITASKQAI